MERSDDFFDVYPDNCDGIYAGGKDITTTTSHSRLSTKKASLHLLAKLLQKKMFFL